MSQPAPAKMLFGVVAVWPEALTFEIATRNQQSVSQAEAEIMKDIHV